MDSYGVAGIRLGHPISYRNGIGHIPQPLACPLAGESAVPDSEQIDC